MPKFDKRQLELIRGLVGAAIRKCAKNATESNDPEEKAFLWRTQDEFNGIMALFDAESQADTSQDAEEDDDGSED